MKILIVSSSGYGSTREIAEAIGAVLSDKNEFQIEYSAIDEITSIDSFDAVLIGSSVRADRPLANTRDFFAKFHNDLARKPFALFLVCLSAITLSGKERALREYIPQLLVRHPRLHPVDVEAFAGKIDFAKLNPVMQILVRKVLNKLQIPADGTVDARDWKAIRAWAENLRTELLKKKVEKPQFTPTGAHLPLQVG